MASEKNESSGGGLIQNIIFLLVWWKLYLIMGGTFTASWSLMTAIVSFFIALLATSVLWLIFGGLILLFVFAIVAMFAAIGGGVSSVNQKHKKLQKAERQKILQGALEKAREEANKQEAERIAAAELEEFLRKNRPPEISEAANTEAETAPLTATDWDKRQNEILEEFQRTGLHIVRQRRI